MKSFEIREKFLKYFQSQGHQLVSSSSLVPADDPTILFTNAGMNQFKKVFLGAEKRNYKRAVSAQKCMRAGGKHNDLENVGLTARHHTFFEMLGNFSFGDYFKEEAIAYAWEFFTSASSGLNLPKDKIYVSIYEKDEESKKIWKKVDPILKDRIYPFGEKDNFWSMGETGPCGPCSELIFDRGEKFDCGKKSCGVGCDCNRYVELWNLVFMQFKRTEEGKLEPLPVPSVDTGLGFERVCAVMQNVDSNYETDLFLPLIYRIEKLSKKKYSPDQAGVSFRVIADHIRALTFCIADGVIPSNEGRGYVVRRILRRAARHGKLLNLPTPFLSQLTELVVQSLGKQYPEIKAKKSHIDLVIKSEEESFEKTLDTGLELFEKVAHQVKKQGKKIIPGSEAFKLYDTFGFPLDLTQVMAKEKNLEVDLEGFEKELAKQRERSLKASKFEAFPEISGLKTKLKKVEFVGYDNLEADSTVEEVWESPNGKKFLILEKTPFYAEAGGQVGDTGKITQEKLNFQVLDTQKENEIILHLIQSNDAKDKITLDKKIRGLQVLAKVDRERRKAIMKNHTATHLLHRALREFLGDHVHQAGSLVAPDRLRFDFTHFKELSDHDISKLEYNINQRIWDNLDVLPIFDLPLKEALAMGAMALFGEKYGDRVRVIRIGDYSLELCGGTHTKTTGEIGIFRITSEVGVASGVRRIEAVTGETAYKIMREERNKLIQGASLLKTDLDKYLDRLETLLEEKKKIENRLKQLEGGKAAESALKIFQEAKEIRGVKYFAVNLGKLESKEQLLNFADSFRRIPEFEKSYSVGVLVTQINGNFTILTISSSSAVKEKNLKADQILRELSTLAGGSGGGKPTLATGGIKNPEKIKEVLEGLPIILEKYLKS